MHFRGVYIDRQSILFHSNYANPKGKNCSLHFQRGDPNLCTGPARWTRAGVLPRGVAREQMPITDGGICQLGPVLPPPNHLDPSLLLEPLLLLCPSLPPSSAGLHTQPPAPKRQPHGPAARLPGSMLASRAWWEECQAGSSSSCVTLDTFPHRAHFLIY